LKRPTNSTLSERLEGAERDVDDDRASPDAGAALELRLGTSPGIVGGEICGDHLRSVGRPTAVTVISARSATAMTSSAS
jgi:NAD(P)H-dependent FMN reductase